MAKQKRKLEDDTTEDRKDRKGNSDRKSKSKRRKPIVTEPDHNGEEQDEISIQMDKEKKKALEILDSILDDSISSKRDDTNDKAVLANGGQEERETQGDRVEAEGERFYSVDDDLKKLFSSTDGSDGFCFLAEKEEESEMKDTESSPQKEQTEVTNDKTSQNEKHTPKPFFFHSNNTTLRNRLDENFFYRTKSLEELEEEWPEKRTAMKNSFKKRHKDALKLNRKRKGIIAQR